MESSGSLPLAVASLSLPVWSAAAWPAQREAYRTRIRSALGVVAIHVLLGYALIAGLGYRPDILPEETLKLFDIAAEAPPAPRPASDSP